MKLELFASRALSHQFVRLISTRRPSRSLTGRILASPRRGGEEVVEERSPELAAGESAKMFSANSGFPLFCCCCHSLHLHLHLRWTWSSIPVSLSLSLSVFFLFTCPLYSQSLSLTCFRSLDTLGGRNCHVGLVALPPPLNTSQTDTHSDSSWTSFFNR